MSTASLHKVVTEEAMLWGDAVAEPYHAIAASHMEHHWAGLIEPALSGIDVNLLHCADFACGRGRNTLKLLAKGAHHVTMIDVNPENVAYCREHIDPKEKISVVQINGLDLGGVADDVFTFFYTFDAAVHFDVEILLGYIREFHRVMKSGAIALVHHSNYDQRPGSDFRENPNWRNYMTASLFKHVAIRRGFEVVKQNIISWAGVENGDCISVLRKP